METKRSEDKFDSPSEKLIEATRDCNEHYAGMLEVYDEALQVIRSKKSIEDLKSYYNSKKKINPERNNRDEALGLSDALKIIARMIDGVESGSEFMEDADLYLETQIKRIRPLVEESPIE